VDKRRRKEMGTKYRRMVSFGIIVFVFYVRKFPSWRGFGKSGSN
jgi:hypothetical protein